MYKVPRFAKTNLEVNETYEGESLEGKIERMLSNKEPMEGGSPEIFTERKDGVNAGYNIRTDRFEVAIEAKDGQARSIQARREERAKNPDKADATIGGKEGEINGETKSTQGTE